MDNRLGWALEENWKQNWTELKSWRCESAEVVVGGGGRSSSICHWVSSESVDPKLAGWQTRDFRNNNPVPVASSCI